MAKRPIRYDANLPRNLTFRKRDKTDSWRNPITGQEILLGKLDRKDAVSQAIEANNYLDQNDLPSSLLERIKEIPSFTVLSWLERDSVILGQRELKPGPLTPDGLTQAFSDIRDCSGIKFGANTPSFHEIRSLARSSVRKRTRGRLFPEIIRTQ